MVCSILGPLPNEPKHQGMRFSPFWFSTPVEPWIGPLLAQREGSSFRKKPFPCLISSRTTLCRWRRWPAGGPGRGSRPARRRRRQRRGCPSGRGTRGAPAGRRGGRGQGWPAGAEGGGQMTQMTQTTPLDPLRPVLRKWRKILNPPPQMRP